MEVEGAAPGAREGGGREWVSVGGGSIAGSGCATIRRVECECEWKRVEGRHRCDFSRSLGRSWRQLQLARARVKEDSAEWSTTRH